MVVPSPTILRFPDPLGETAPPEFPVTVAVKLPGTSDAVRVFVAELPMIVIVVPSPWTNIVLLPLGEIAPPLLAVRVSSELVITPS
jgi:hypothetical protein